MGRDGFRQKAAQIRQMLIAGDRAGEATAVEQKALSFDSSDEMKQWLAKPRDRMLGGLYRERLAEARPDAW